MTSAPPSGLPAKRKTSLRKRVRNEPASAVKQPLAATPEEPGLVDQVRTMADRFLDLASVAGIAGRTLQTASRVSRALREGQAIDAATEVLRAVLPSLPESAAWVGTGTAIRAMREKAGLTVAEVSAALDLEDPSLIDALENGRIALSFELILRLAAVFGRNDPIGFVTRWTRASNPQLWQSLEKLGVGKLVLQTVREHQFVNVYRGHDDARSLSDEEFAEILSFTQAAFEMAIAMRKRYVQRSSAAISENKP